MKSFRKKDIISWILTDRSLQNWLEKEVEASDAEVDSAISERMFSRIKQETVGKKPAIYELNLRWLKWAAVILLPICLAVSVYYAVDVISRVDNQYFMVKADKGDRAQLELSDGSKVILNSASSLSYRGSFGKDERRVALQGEAYFQVAKDEKCPFIVNTGALTVRVLGTSFNLSAYDELDEVVVVLLEGSVDVEANGTSLKMIPGDKLAYNKHTLQMHKSSVHSADYIEWTKGNLYFERESLKNIMQALSRVYNVEIRIESDKLQEDLFTGTIPGNSIENAMDILKLTANFRYELKDSVIVVKE